MMMASRCHLGKWCYFRRHNLFGGDVESLFRGKKYPNPWDFSHKDPAPHYGDQILWLSRGGAHHLQGSWLGTVDPGPPHLASKKKPYGIHIYATPILVVCIYIYMYICNTCSISYVAFFPSTGKWWTNILNSMGSLPIPSNRAPWWCKTWIPIHKLARPGGFRHDRLENVGWPLGRRLLVRMVDRGEATSIGTHASHGSMETQVIFILFPVGFL